MTTTETERGWPEDRLISIAEALTIVGISRSSAYRMMEQGKMPQTIKVGKRAFYSKREIEGWIAEKLAGPRGGNGHE